MRKRIASVLAVVCLLLSGIAVGRLESETESPQPAKSLFDKTVDVIKKYEGLHSARHWPLVGYGHKVLPTDNFKRGKALTEAQADELLRKDLSKLCANYRSFGPDSLLLAALAYNIGTGAVSRSSVYKKLKAGDRNIEANYLAHSKYRGKTLSQLKRRRQEELETLFNVIEMSEEVQAIEDSLASQMASIHAPVQGGV